MKTCWNSRDGSGCRQRYMSPRLTFRVVALIAQKTSSGPAYTRQIG